MFLPEAVNMETSHIFPAKKQQSFLNDIFKGRSQLYDPPSSIVGYDDIRNGILLDIFTHLEFDRRKVALIRVPNHILSDEDVPCNKSAKIQTYIDGRPYRYALHILDDTLVWLTSLYDGHWSLDIPLPNATEDTAPPQYLVDYIYGVSVLMCFGEEADVEMLKTLYPGVPEESQVLDPVRPTVRRTPADYRRLVEKHDSPGQGTGDVTDDTMTLRDLEALEDSHQHSTFSSGSLPTSDEESMDEKVAAAFEKMYRLNVCIHGSRTSERRRKEEEVKQSAIREWADSVEIGC
ncbi:hypothetical protein OF83DRAFT_1178843 [Amylostereum chailletii]|nr:hypothetical protein OF83DRAFT_1178843 [Amylostereum chailletii]